MFTNRFLIQCKFLSGDRREMVKNNISDRTMGFPWPRMAVVAVHFFRLAIPLFYADKTDCAAAGHEQNPAKEFAGVCWRTSILPQCSSLKKEAGARWQRMEPAYLIYG